MHIFLGHSCDGAWLCCNGAKGARKVRHAHSVQSCPALIYAAVKFIQEWASPLKVVNYAATWLIEQEADFQAPADKGVLYALRIDDENRFIGL